MGRVERSQKLKTDVGNVRNFGSRHEISWKEPNVVRLDRTDAEDSSSWCENGEAAVVS